MILQIAAITIALGAQAGACTRETAAALQRASQARGSRNRGTTLVEELPGGRVFVQFFERQGRTRTQELRLYVPNENGGYNVDREITVTQQGKVSHHGNKFTSATAPYLPEYTLMGFAAKHPLRHDFALPIDAVRENLHLLLPLYRARKNTGEEVGTLALYVAALNSPLADSAFQTFVRQFSLTKTQAEAYLSGLNTITDTANDIEQTRLRHILDGLNELRRAGLDPQAATVVRRLLDGLGDALEGG